MKIDFNFIMAVINAVQAVEGVIKGGENKKQKAIEIAKTAIGVAGDVSPKVESAIGQTIDAVVATANALKAA